MATDLETQTEGNEVAPAHPSLKITGLHIRGLKSIKSLDLPEDGMGWNGEIPDFVMVGGINGSGKTTLLEFLAGVFELLIRDFEPLKLQELPIKLQAEQARIDFQLSIPGNLDEEISFLVGDETFLDVNGNGRIWFGFLYDPSRRPYGFYRYQKQIDLSDRLEDCIICSKFGDKFSSPAVVHFPSEGRTLISPDTNYKFAGKLSDQFNFVYRWQPPKEWLDSLAARLYAIRWEDLNAKEEGRDDEANGFKAYSQAFDRFFEGRRRLKWDHGELVVETKSGAIHDLSELSSGEKQVILFMGELLHRWRPGSLILIDEPELHLHEYYQTKLWVALLDWQKERGGQVIVATQSGHLFQISEPGIKVLLGGENLR